jgi:Flp pilus assembly protein TadG
MRARGDRGSALVEAAFVLPVLVFVVLSMMDIGFWEFQQTQAQNAARDGARVAILHYLNADTNGSDYALIKAGVASHIAGQTLSSGFPTVECRSGTTNAVISCATATPGTDTITVGAQWTRSPFSAAGSLFGIETISGSSTGVIIGVPQ